MKNAALLAVVALSACAGPVQLPPPRYQITGSFHVVTKHDVAESCGKGVLSCTFGVGKKDQSTIVMPDPCLYGWDFYAALLCHENAHAMGWSVNHDN